MTSSDRPAWTQPAWLARAGLAVALPAALAATGLGPLLAYRHRLPGRLATHWNAAGSADGSMTLRQALAVQALVLVPVTAALVAAGLPRRPQPAGIRQLRASLPALVGGLIAATSPIVVAANLDLDLDAAAWRTAPGPPVPAVVGMVVAGLGFAAAASWLAGALPARPEPAAPTPRLGLSTPERAVWVGRGNLHLFHRAALVLRAGAGLRLDLHDGGVFVVTIDQPDQPAALLNDEIVRIPPASRQPTAP